MGGNWQDSSTEWNEFCKKANEAQRSAEEWDRLKTKYGLPFGQFVSGHDEFVAPPPEDVPEDTHAEWLRLNTGIE